jgi:hypothetical protein
MDYETAEAVGFQDDSEYREMEAQVEDKFELLKHSSNYWFLIKTLRPNGIGGIIFGALAIVGGIASIPVNPVNILLVLVGAFLFVSGVFVVAVPKPSGLITEGVAFIIVGVWNIFVTILNIIAADTEAGFPGFFGIVQIALGIHCFVRYRHFASIPMMKPTNEIKKVIKDTYKSIKKESARKNENIIEFKANTFVKPLSWKASLEEDYAIFIETKGNDIIFAKKPEVQITQTGKVLIGKSAKVEFHLPYRKMTGVISQESLARYEQWKQTLTDEQTADAELSG